MRDFSLDGITIKLVPLDLNGIEDRIRWNTSSAEWKKIDDPNYTVQSLNITEYRKKKTQEILSGKRYIHGIYTSLEIYTKSGMHIGFINCYPFPQKQDTTDSLAIGIIIPEDM